MQLESPLINLSESAANRLLWMFVMFSHCMHPTSLAVQMLIII